MGLRPRYVMDSFIIFWKEVVEIRMIVVLDKISKINKRLNNINVK